MKVIWTDYIEYLQTENSYRIKGTSIDPHKVINLIQDQKEIDHIINLSQGLTPDHIEACREFWGNQNALFALKTLIK